MQLKLTPMMQQYKKIKRSIPDGCILMYRLGDFYEMFFEDAKTASGILNIALTKRSREEGRDYPMCGIPYHAAEGYIGKLVKAGYKVAVCDQTEDPKKAKGIVRRDVTRVITPGTVMDSRLLDEKKNNYLTAVNKVGKMYSISLLDLSTGEFRVTELDCEEDFFSEFMRISPAECIMPQGIKGILDKINGNGHVMMNYEEDWIFDYDSCYHLLKEHFRLQSLDGYGCQGMVPGITTAGAIIHYLKSNMHQSLGHIQNLVPYVIGDYMALDNATVRNLELTDSLHGGPVAATLFGVLDYTVTGMGARLLCQWIKQPLVKAETIKKRQEGVKFFYYDKNIREGLKGIMKNIPDIERITGRISAGYANARDLVALREALKTVPGIKEYLKESDCALLQEINEGLVVPMDLIVCLDKALLPDPPLVLREGGFIRDGYNEELDELREISKEAKGYLARLQAEESAKTGIKSLKVRYNKVFGYYIEISKANLNAVPEDYIRRQTLVNAERFITPELKDYESKILNAKERIGELEYDIFVRLRGDVGKYITVIQNTARGIGTLDVLLSFSEAGLRNNYVFPEINDGPVIDITAGRHPVLEICLEERKRFVPNDILLNSSRDHLLIITGPNMAGKSTYIRQTALLVLMAQMGCGIPAQKAVCGVVDRIFTRVGASDELTRGQSTFMVEMNETAYILNNATARSLIILDEIGRGTSTYDGISIAWAVAEYLATGKRGEEEFQGPKTMFATHYHELTRLADFYPAVKNYNIAVREWNDEVIFLYKILPGSTDKSYGIHVARLAGLPYGVLARAKDIMSDLEQGQFFTEGAGSGQGKTRQMRLFDMPGNHIVESLSSMKLEHMTPIEALNKLKELKEKVR